MSLPVRSLPDTSHLEADDAKEQLRKMLREGRRHHHRHPLSGHDATCAALTTHALEAVGGMHSVAAYVSVGHEPCTQPLLEELTRLGVTVLLPVLGPQLSRCWGRLSSIAELQERAPGRPPEPRGAVLPAEAVGEVQALIVPALAVDRGGRRLGQGGGWYDRMLPLRGEGVQVFAMVHHDELVAGPLPQEPHDMPVDAVITEQAWFLLKGSAFSAGAC